MAKQQKGVNIKNAVLFIVLMVLFTAIFLVAKLPAQLAWDIAKPNIRLPKFFQIKSLRGSVWHGGGELLVDVSKLGAQSATPGPLPVKLEWRFLPALALKGKLAIGLRMQSDLGSLDGSMERSLQAYGINVNNFLIALDQLAMFLPPRVRLARSLTGHELHAEVSENKVRDISGSLSWPGGEVAYPVGRSTHTRNLPALSGKLTHEGGNAILRVLTTSDQKILLELALDQQGWGSLSVRRRLMEVVNEPFGGKAEPDAVIFNVKKRLMQTP